MKKRMVTLALALCVALSLAVPAGAAMVNDAVEQDMAAMKQALFNVDAITVYSVDNGVTTYAYQLTEDVVDYVTVQHNENGSVTLDIWEEDRHDVMVVLPDGALVINGEPLVPPAPEPELATQEIFSSLLASCPWQIGVYGTIVKIPFLARRDIILTTQA